MKKEKGAFSKGILLLLALVVCAPLRAAPLVHEDTKIAAIDERPIRFYIDRPQSTEKLPLLIVIDGSGCVGQLRPSSWGNYAPQPDDPVRYARLMVEKPGVAPDASDHSVECSKEFYRSYTINNRVQDHLRVLQHLNARADWWNGEVLVWGWSDGGDVAAQLVVARPDIRRAVLGAMGGGYTMAEHFENFWACAPASTAQRDKCLADLRSDFARIENNPSGTLYWNGESHATWASRLRSRLSAPLADNRVPILIVHGELDKENTPVESARKLVSDLQASGNSAFTYWEIAGMGHGWRELPDSRQAVVLSSMLNWLLKGEIDPDQLALAVHGKRVSKD